jgi:hypothetical protein
MQMLALRMQQVPSLETRQEMSRTFGGATSSVFTLTSSLIQSDTSYLAAAQRLVDLRSRTELEYRSMMDLIFCELFPEWRDPCRWFYTGYGPQIGEYMTRRSIRLHDAAMVIALELSRASGDRFSDQTWFAFRARFERALPKLLVG